MISLYFHIPFCTKKCPYCHFYVVPNRLSYHEVLTEGLFLEWEKQLPLLQGHTIASIYFGGGTPTLFAPSGIEKVLQMIQKSGITLSPSCEITIEGNPEEGSLSLFQDLRSLGINRLSLGIQSLDDRSLQTLERTHSAKKAKETLLTAEAGGFQNISIDLMYDLPDQTDASWQYTLSQLSHIPFQHLSLYNLTIEPHTAFDKKKENLTFPSPHVSLNMLHTAVETLENLGLERYEISAFAKPGYKSNHNLGYWMARPFLGFGPSACSFWEKKRFRNTSSLQKYTEKLKKGLSPIEFEEELPYPQNIKEQFAVRLRLLEGAPWDPTFPKEMKQTIEKLIGQNLLKQVKQPHLNFGHIHPKTQTPPETQSFIQLTEKGILFHDTVAAEIV